MLKENKTRFPNYDLWPRDCRFFLSMDTESRYMTNRWHTTVLEVQVRIEVKVEVEVEVEVILLLWHARFEDYSDWI
jgi:hypothetical protein